MQVESCTSVFKICSLCFQRKKITKTHRLSCCCCCYFSYFGKSSLCTAGSKKEILYMEADCSVLKLVTKFVSLTGFSFTWSFQTNPVTWLYFPVKTVLLK